MTESTETRGLSIEDLHVLRDERAVLDGVSLTVPGKSITTLLGPNGAGKSTLVLALGGLLPVARGTVKLGDRTVSGLSPERIRAAGVAVVPEGRWLLRGLTVEENLTVATYGMSKADAAAGMATVKELFPELVKRWTSRASLLSGGEQQMVALAQALATRPSVLVVDELSLGLAPVVVRRLIPVLQDVAATGMAVLLIEQFADVALSVADNAYILEGGRMHYSGDAKHLRDNPGLLSAAYLAHAGSR